MKYALIGCGRIAPNHLEAAVNNNLEVVGICDIIPEHMDILLEKVGMKDRNFKQYTDYHEMLEKEKTRISSNSYRKWRTCKNCVRLFRCRM